MTGAAHRPRPLRRGDRQAQPDHHRVGRLLPDRVSKRAFGALDAHLWRLAWKWAKLSHPNKPRRWIIARYFGMSNPARQDK